MRTTYASDPNMLPPPPLFYTQPHIYAQESVIYMGGSKTTPNNILMEFFYLIKIIDENA